MANKNLLKSKAVIKAISIGLAAMMAMTPVVGATDVYADETEPEGTPEGATESATESSTAKEADGDPTVTTSSRDESGATTTVTETTQNYTDGSVETRTEEHTIYHDKSEYITEGVTEDTPGAVLLEEGKSSGSIKELEQDAYEEVVHHDATYTTKTVVDQEAYDETVHHDAVTHEETVVDQDAWIETVHHEAETHEEYIDGKTITVVDKEAWDEFIPHETTYKTITVVDQEAWNETVHHDAVTHEEKVVDQEAWDETIHHDETYKTVTVVDKEAYDETINHEAETHEEKVVDKEAWTEVIHHEAVTHEEYIDGKTITVVDKEAWDETIEHEATYKTVTVVDKEAYDETIHHDAETHEEEEIVKEAWDESIRKENDFSDRQSSVCREIINGHIHGDISAEEYYTATINKAEYEIQGIGNIKGSLVNNLYKYADEYNKATGYSIWNLNLQTGNYEKNPIRSTNKDELEAFVNWANETNFFAENGVKVDGELSVVTIKEETITKTGEAYPGDNWEGSEHNIGGDYKYDSEYWNKIAEGFKTLTNESIVVIEKASDFLGILEKRISEGKVPIGNKEDGAEEIKHIDDPTGKDNGKSWIADVCDSVFVYTGTDKLTIPGYHGSVNLGAIIAPNATIDFSTGEGAALVICDTLIANLQMHINLSLIHI